jgi:hypothetical protein
MKQRSRIDAICGQCSTPFRPIKYEYEHGRGRFCSYSCSMLSRPHEGLESRFWSKVHKTPTCWEWTASTSRTGYGTIKYDKKTMLAHRISYQLAYGETPEGALICHTCDNRRCVNPDHLFVGTHKDNTQDAVKKGRMSHGPKHWTNKSPKRVARGSRAGLAKLTEKDIPTIRKLALTEPLTSIAERYDVMPTTIGQIVRGGTWRHVK